MPQKTHTMHGRDHEPHGADPIRFPTSIPGDFQSMALAWSDAYWKLEETETGSLFLDELPGHHDLQTTTETGLTRGVGHGPAEPDSIGIILDGPAMGPSEGSPGPQLQTAAADEALGVVEEDSVGFFAVVAPDAPGEGAYNQYQFYTIGGVYDPDAGGTPFSRMRWALVLAPTEVIETPPTPNTWGYHLAAFVGDGTGSYGSTAQVHGGTLLAHLDGATLPGEEFDVALTYNSSVLSIYFNGGLEASAGIGSQWVNDTRSGRFVLGAINFSNDLIGGWWNHHGGIGMAMLKVDGTLTSGQIQNLHTGEPTVGSLPGEISPDQHGVIPSGDLHPEYLQESAYEPGVEVEY